MAERVKRHGGFIRNVPEAWRMLKLTLHHSIYGHPESELVKMFSFSDYYHCKECGLRYIEKGDM